MLFDDIKRDWKGIPVMLMPKRLGGERKAPTASASRTLTAANTAATKRTINVAFIRFKVTMARSLFAKHSVETAKASLPQRTITIGFQ